jgi:hypothetical protein
MTDNVNKLIELELFDRKLREEMSRQMGRPVVGGSFVVTNNRANAEALATTSSNAVTTPQDSIFDLDTIAMQFEEFLLRHSRMADDKRWTDEFKELLRQLSGDAVTYRYKGRIVADDSRNGRFTLSKLRQDDPALVQEFTRWKTEEAFDEEAFKAAHPDLWEQYRAQRFELK